MFFFTGGSGVEYMSPSFEQIPGFNIEDAKSKKFWELAHPDMRELVKNRGLDRQRGEQVCIIYVSG